MKNFNIEKINLTKYLFFTGKGGVGKTSIAASCAVALADLGKKVLLISTDPASNLEDIFKVKLKSKETKIDEVDNLFAINLDPIEAANEYRESVVSEYRGVLPDSAIKNIQEQLSGSCTVEIAAFNEFSRFISDDYFKEEYDHIIFDTAPTGHTLRMLELPSAWNDFLDTNTSGASCLGQLQGLEDKKQSYERAVNTLKSSQKTSLILVTRPEETALKEASRAYDELENIGINLSLIHI